MEVTLIKNFFTKITDTAENRLSALYGHISRSRARSVAVSLIIYTVLFAVFFIFAFGNVISETGYLLEGDGVAQYLPFLKGLRKAEEQLIDSIAAGAPVLPMTDLDYCFGGDSVIMVYADMLPMLPFYAFSVFFPEETMPQFMTAGVVLFSYLAGLSFIRMCAYFRQNVITAGLAAPLYVFCGCYLETLVYNPHFMYMQIAFPIMVIGIDRVIHDRNGIPLTLGVTFLGLCGVNLLVYCMPFVVIFAAIRVFYVHKGRFAPALIKYFLTGTLYTLLGIMTAGVLLLPYLNALLASGRTLGDPGLTAIEFLIPDIDNLYNYFTAPNDINGVSSAIMPFFLYAFTRRDKNKELRAYGIAAVIATGLPLVMYGLNGFLYDIERWAFIYALLVCFMFVRYLPEIAKGHGNTSGTAVCAVFWALIFTLPLGRYAVIPALVMMLFIKPLRKAAAWIKNKLIKVYAVIKAGFSGKYSIIFLAAAVAAAVIILIGTILIISFKLYVFLGFFLAAFLLFAAVTVFARKSGKRYTAGSLMAAGCAVLALFQIQPADMTSGIAPEMDKFIDHIAAEEASLPGDEKNRYAELYPFEEETEETNDEKEAVPEAADSKDSNVSNIRKRVFVETCLLNSTLGNNVSVAKIFNSVIPGDLLAFFDRIGMDDRARVSPGEIESLSQRHELYSLFGIGRTYSLYLPARMYGMDLSETFVYPDSSGIDRSFYIYDNPYALPLGTLYDKTMSRADFESYNSVELPYAMLDAVYLEGYDGPAAEVSRICPEECDAVKEKVSRGVNRIGMECFDNTLIPNESVKDCFLYITFDDVKTGSMRYADHEYLEVFADDTMCGGFYLNNILFLPDMPWLHIGDHYTMSLGYMEEDIGKITFISTFDFSSVKLYKVPRTLFTETAAKRQSEAMYDIHTGINTLIGMTDLTEDRILSVGLLYSSGWDAYIDGERTDTYKANGLFIGIPVSAGRHEIRLVYHTPLIYEGLALTGTGIIIIITTAIISRRKERNRRK